MNLHYFKTMPRNKSLGPWRMVYLAGRKFNESKVSLQLHGRSDARKRLYYTWSETVGANLLTRFVGFCRDQAPLA